ncbi:MAG: hypothetical protein ACFFDP_13325, partial [Promethearchaeota archaeon]
MPRVKVSSLILCLFLVIPVAAQSFTTNIPLHRSACSLKSPTHVLGTFWNNTFSGAEMDEAWSLVQCQGGGFVLAGTTNSSGAGDVDAWLVRTNPAGIHLWNQTYGGSAQDEVYSVVECIGGGFALLGTSYTYDNPPNFGDVWLIRTDS